MGKLLSFVIPVYNSNDTLEECVNSIIKQVNGEEVEILIVDDGSGMECRELCDAIAENHKDMVHVLHKRNGGSLSARLLGGGASIGDYIIYVDADDVLLDGALSRIRRDITSGADLYLYDYTMDAVGGEASCVIKIMPYNQVMLFEGENKKEVYSAFMGGMMNTVCACAIKANVLKTSSLSCPEKKIKHGEDRLQKLFLLLNADRIVYIPHSFYHYRWFQGTQGEEVRLGKFDLRVYEDFCLTWQAEREHYDLMGFSEKDKLQYDGKKLSRVCGLIETSFDKNEISIVTLTKLVNTLSENELFRQISSKESRSTQRSHVNNIASMIRRNHAKSLICYLKICCKLRGLLYGRAKRRAG